VVAGHSSATKSLGLWGMFRVSLVAKFHIIGNTLTQGGQGAGLDNIQDRNNSKMNLLTRYGGFYDVGGWRWPSIQKLAVQVITSSAWTQSLIPSNGGHPHRRILWCRRWRLLEYVTYN